MILGPVVQIAAFALFAFIAIAGALGMTTTMSMFRSGIFLMGSFIGVAGLFIMLSADLIGLLQVMMYIGGMLVMILFMVLFMHDPGGAMMASMDMSPIEKLFSRGIPPMEMDHGDMDHSQMKHGDDQQMNHSQMQHDDGMHMDHDSMNHSEMQHDDGDQSMNHDEMQHDDGDHQQMQHDDNDDMHMDHGSMNHGDMQHEGMDMGGMDMDMSMTTPLKRPAAMLATIVGVLLVGLLVLRPAWPVSAATPNPNSAEIVGQLLMGKYMMAFEAAGLLILIGIFGAVFLARPGAFPDQSGRDAHVAHNDTPVEAGDAPLEPLMPEEQPGEDEEESVLTSHALD